MVKNLRPWLDKKVASSESTSAQMTQSDRWSDATITGQEDSTRVSAHLEGSSQPDVVVPSDSGVSAVGARVRAFRDSTGRVTHVSIPDVIPEGAATFTVGVTGERLVQLDATQVDQGAQIDRVEAGLDSARVELSAAMERLNDPDTGLDATQQKADDAATAAAQASVAAGTLADSKAKTFTTTPTVPYSVGDLWRNGNKVYICTTARTSGSYTASDWTLTADKTSENTAADTSKVGGTASATVIQNIATALANGKPFIQQATPSATAVGQLWFPTNSSGQVIGMKVSTATGTGSWQNYLMMAGQILVPGSVGTTEIGPEGVTAANIKASNELWAKLATFAKVTTDMLIAGNATITNDMIVENLIGKMISGSEYVMRGDSDQSSVRIYKASDGSPILDVAQADGAVRMRITKPASGQASIKFYGPEGAGGEMRGIGWDGIAYTDNEDDPGQSPTLMQPWDEAIPVRQLLKISDTASQTTTSGSWATKTWTVTTTTDLTVGSALAYSTSGAIRVWAEVRPYYYRVTARVRWGGVATAGLRGLRIALDGVLVGQTAVTGAVSSQDTTIEITEYVRVTRRSETELYRNLTLEVFQNSGSSPITSATVAVESLYPEPVQ